MLQLHAGVSEQVPRHRGGFRNIRVDSQAVISKYKTVLAGLGQRMF
jgi:hypothetical protein